MTISDDSAIYVMRVYRGPYRILTVVVGSKSADIPMATTLFQEVSEAR